MNERELATVAYLVCSVALVWILFRLPLPGDRGRQLIHERILAREERAWRKLQLELEVQIEVAREERRERFKREAKREAKKATTTPVNDWPDDEF